jgi:hypothetical protein
MKKPYPVAFGKKIKLAPAPRFTCYADGLSLTTIYGSHYGRLQAVVDAARTGNRLLIRLALEYHDKFGSGDEPKKAD